MTDRNLWEFKFGVEVSARYHAWRRGTLEACARFVRAATFVGAVVTLLIALAPLNLAPGSVTVIVVLSSIAIAIVNLWDLISGFSDRAHAHADLYKRSKSLQERMALETPSWEESLPTWEAAAQSIRRDEPPTMWAVYAACWNQTIEQHGAQRDGYFRRVGKPHYWLRNMMQFRPQDFPAATEPKSS